jgi:LysM repeat protein
MFKRRSAKFKMPLALRNPQSYFRRMKRICRFTAFCLLAFAPLLRGQELNPNSPPPASREEAAENYNTLKGHVDDLLAAQADQLKQIQDLKKDLEELRQQISKPNGNYASQDDLKQLADAIRELDKKREADKELILKEMEQLGKTVSGPLPTHTSIKPVVSDPGSGATSSPGPDQNGFYYTIKKDDTLSLIAQAYREQGVKVTSKQIADANPNVNPAKLHVGVKIFIPAPKGSK